VAGVVYYSRIHTRVVRNPSKIFDKATIILSPPRSRTNIADNFGNRFLPLIALLKPQYSGLVDQAIASEISAVTK
jgi:hypothetical protein